MAFDTLPALPTTTDYYPAAYTADYGQTVAPFPGSVLDIRTELYFGALGWQDITPFVYARTDVTIGRGKPDELTSATPSSLGLVLNNRDSRFSSKNPAGPYWPYLGRNTPVRVSVPEGAAYLRLEDDQTSYAQGPSSGAVVITGDMDVQADITLDSWASQQLIASRWASTGNQRTWILGVQEGGYLDLYLSSDGATTVHAVATVPVTPPPLRRQCVRVTFAAATGTVTFWTSPPGLSSPVWTQLGTPVVLGAMTLFAGTAALECGWRSVTADSRPSMYGKFHAMLLLSGIGGTTVASPDFTAQVPGATSFTDAQGNTWTLASTAVITDRKYRFWGEASAWPQGWTPDGKDVWVTLAGGGLWRRYTQGAGHRPLQSAMRRAIPRVTGVTAYWPCEDGNDQSGGGATPLPPARITSPIAGVPAGVFSGSPQFAASSDFACSYAIPAVNQSVWKFSIPSHAGTDAANQLWFLMVLPSGGDTTSIDVLRLYTGGTCATIGFYLGTGDTLQLYGNNSAGGSVFNSGPFAFNINGVPVLVAITLTNNGGGTVKYAVQVEGLGTRTFGDFTGTFTGTIGNGSQVIVNPSAIAGLTGTAIGQVAYVNQATNFQTALQNPLNAWNGETAGSRFQRLCSEENVPFRWRGSLADTVPMGAQTPLDLATLLQECIDADRGVLWEPRHVLALGYRTRASMQNQPPAVTLTYTAAELAGTMSATEDDQYTLNDAIVTSTYTGGSAEVAVTSGALSTQPPPSGAGAYQQSLQLNLGSDALCGDLAGWVTWLGTVNEPRYPALPVNLARSEITSSPSLYFGLQDLDLGDRAVVASVPGWLPPDGITQLVSATSEKLNAFVQAVDVTGVPEDPYETTVADDLVLGHADTPGSSLNAPVTSTATSMAVNTTGDLWTTNAADFPFDLEVDGERMTCTAISGAANPQTFTVTRSVNGVVKAHSAGVAVAMFYPQVAGL